MAAQAFFYNAIFFTYALVLTDFYGVAGRARRLVHPAVRGRQFPRAAAARPAVRHARAPADDRAHLRRCRACCWRCTGWLFAQACSTRATQTLAWSVIFFFASAAASSAYLTVSETFPLEMRALAIAIFYAVGTGVGGVVGPLAVRRADRDRLAHERVRAATCSAPR